MKFKINDKTKNKLYQQNKSLFQSFLSEVSRKLFLKEDVQISFLDDEENSKNILGRTAHYNPSLNEVSIFCTNRHPKDVLRSISHELVHHRQNENGMLRNIVAEDGYAQNDSHLRNLEKEAFLKGNMIFRDWEDQYKIKIGLNEQQDFRSNAERWIDNYKAGKEEKLAKQAFPDAKIRRLALAIAKHMNNSGVPMSRATANNLNRHDFRFGTTKEDKFFLSVFDDLLVRLDRSGKLSSVKWLLDEVRKQTIFALARALPTEKEQTQRLNASPVNEHIVFSLNALQENKYLGSFLKENKNPIVMERAEKLAQRIFDGLLPASKKR